LQAAVAAAAKHAALLGQSRAVLFASRLALLGCEAKFLAALKHHSERQRSA
jgi:hypothetical protein